MLDAPARVVAGPPESDSNLWRLLFKISRNLRCEICAEEVSRENTRTPSGLVNERRDISRCSLRLCLRKVPGKPLHSKFGAAGHAADWPKTDGNIWHPSVKVRCKPLRFQEHVGRHVLLPCLHAPTEDPAVNSLKGASCATRDSPYGPEPTITVECISAYLSIVFGTIAIC